MTEPPVSILFLGRSPGTARDCARRCAASQSYPDRKLRFVDLGEEQEGVRAADINHAAASIDTPYLIAADGSLEPEKDWVAELVAEARQSSRIVAVAPKILAPGNIIASVGAGLTPGYRWHDRGSGEVDTGRYGTNREIYAITLLGALIDRRRLLEVGGLAEVFRTSYADIDLSIRLIERGYRLRYAPHAVVHRQAGAPGADRNPSPPQAAAEWERLTLIARRFPDLLSAELPAAGAILAGDTGAGGQLAELLAQWGPTAADAEIRRALQDRIESNPGSSAALLSEAWERSAP